MITTYNILRQIYHEQRLRPRGIIPGIHPSLELLPSRVSASLTSRTRRVYQPPLNPSNLDLTTTTTKLGEINAIFGLPGLFSMTYEVLGISQIL
jgi:hypothetical protein